MSSAPENSKKTSPGKKKRSPGRKSFSTSLKKPWSFLSDSIPAWTLEQLEQRFHEIVDPKRKSLTLGRRLARLFATLFDPDLVLPYLDDPYLVPQVEMDDMADNTALFLCVAMMEEAIDGQVFRNDPANSLGSYLRGEFRKQDWPWPKNPLAWKLHFMRYHAKKLF